MKTTSLASMEMFILDDMIITTIAVMVLLNFILSLYTAYRIRMTTEYVFDGIEHILHHICHEDEEDFEDIGIGIPEDIEQEVSEWMEYCQQHIMEHGRLPTQKEIEKHFNYQSANDKAWKEWEGQA